MPDKTDADREKRLNLIKRIESSYSGTPKVCLEISNLIKRIESIILVFPLPPPLIFTNLIKRIERKYKINHAK